MLRMFFLGEGKKLGGQTEVRTNMGGSKTRRTDGRTDAQYKNGDTHTSYGKLFSKVGYNILME